MNNITLAISAILVSLTALVGSLAAQYHAPAPEALGSVTRGSEYHSTSTDSFYGGLPAVVNLTGTSTTLSGTLGSVIVTGTGTGNVELFDATTTNVNQRVGATSTILLASVPMATAGTYTFDVIFYRGLTLVTTGVTGTSTITWR